MQERGKTSLRLQGSAHIDAPCRLQEEASSFEGRIGFSGKKVPMAGSEQRIAFWIFLCLALCIVGNPVRAEDPVYGKTVKVGDEVGWTYINESSGQPADYETWAEKYTFFVNDILEFNYVPTKQNLYSFDSFEAWTACNFSAAQLLDNGTNGFSQWYLPYEGYYDFASGTYCTKGQKFRIYAVNASSAPFVSPSPPSIAPAPDIAPSWASPDMAPAPASGGDPSPSIELPPAMTTPVGAGVPSPAPPSTSPPATGMQTNFLLLAGVAASLASLVAL